MSRRKRQSNPQKRKAGDVDDVVGSTGLELEPDQATATSNNGMDRFDRMLKAISQRYKVDDNTTPSKPEGQKKIEQARKRVAVNPPKDQGRNDDEEQGNTKRKNENSSLLVEYPLSLAADHPKGVLIYTESIQLNDTLQHPGVPTKWTFTKHEGGYLRNEIWYGDKCTPKLPTSGDLSNIVHNGIAATAEFSLIPTEANYPILRIDLMLIPTKEREGEVPILVLSRLEYSLWRDHIQDCSILDNDPLPLTSLYEKAKEKQFAVEPVNVHVPGLMSELRRYQAQAVRWMVDRECHADDTEDLGFTDLMWEKIDLVYCNGVETTVYFRHHDHAIALENPFGSQNMMRQRLYGGILAEEMGLGKTIEVLATILMNPFNEFVVEQRSKVPMEVEVDGKDTEPGKAPARLGLENLDGPFWQKLSQAEEPVIGSDGRPQSRFNELECVCGGKQRDEPLGCHYCGTLQHPSCTGYDADRDGEFTCIRCSVQGKLNSKTTLIVSPAAIAEQWLEEIEAHVDKDLKVLNYRGAKEQFIRPQSLATYDIVVTTFETLSSELSHTKVNEGLRPNRRARRYFPKPCPLTALKWWRVCLDEAQMIESSSSAVAQMAAKLDAFNRWCVSGTPASREVGDLYGLLNFLRADVFSWKRLWDIMNEKKRMEALAPILWRFSKEDVKDELKIPTQNEIVKHIQMDPVERFFYDRLRDRSTVEARGIVRRCISMHQRIENIASGPSLLHNLDHLRQACCHPLVSQGKEYNLKVKSSNTKGMETVMQSLIAKVKLECSDSLRSMIHGKHGIAGIHQIRDNNDEAIEIYRWVNHTLQEESLLFTVDKFQRLHSLSNFCKLIKKRIALPLDVSNAEAMTLRQADILDEERYSKEAAVIKDVLTKTATDGVNSCYNTLASIQEKLDFKSYANLEHVLKIIHDKERNDVWVEGLKNRNDGVRRLTLGRSTEGVKMALYKEFRQLESARKEVVKALKDLQPLPSRDQIEIAAECENCRVQRTYERRPTCAYCKLNDILGKYEVFLYRVKTSSNLEFKGGMATEVEEPKAQQAPHRRLLGTPQIDRNRQGKCSLEKILEQIRKMTEGYGESTQILDALFAHWKALKEEFREMRNTWKKLWERISVFDEVEMCTQTLQILPEGVEVPEGVKHAYLPKNLLEHENLKNCTTVTESEQKLARSKGHLTYLNTLREGTENGVVQKCPVCHDELQDQFCVLACGHIVCFACNTELIRRTSNGYDCPTCRARCLHADIEYVSSGGKEEDAPVEGSHSAKLRAVIACLKAIREEDPTAKTVVFSQWPRVLQILSAGCTENDIPHISLATTNWKSFGKKLKAFRKDKTIEAVLLPTHNGANGLNLTEATHVIFVEPILNPAVEHQAVSRVHRIGQTKETFVHNFITENTIEENVFTVKKEKRAHTLAHTESKKKLSDYGDMTVGDIAKVMGVTDALPAARPARPARPAYPTRPAHPARRCSDDIEPDDDDDDDDDDENMALRNYMGAALLHSQLEQRPTRATHIESGDDDDDYENMAAVLLGTHLGRLSFLLDRRFWQANVQYHGNSVTRLAAARAITIAQTNAARAQGRLPEGKLGVIQMFGKICDRNIARELLDLPVNSHEHPFVAAEIEGYQAELQESED